MGKTIQISGFPSYVTAESVKDFLEARTAQGSVYATKIRQFKSGGKCCYAIVQFTSARYAEDIVSLASTRFWYGSYYLKVRVMERDIVPRPRTYQQKLEQITLYVGCQVSKNKFLSLWKGTNVSLDISFGVNRLYFFLTHHHKKYKLQLSYEDIWQTYLRCPHHHHSKYLLFQLFGSPRIFEIAESYSEDLFNGPTLNYFKDTQDDEWVRTIDFTPSNSVGQSSVLCLEFPNDCQLTFLRGNFPYTELKGQFSVESTNSYCRNQRLVPIIDLPTGVNLPFQIFFKINLLVQNGCLSGPSLDRGFFLMVNPCFFDIACIEYALDRMYNINECCYDPATWLNDQYRAYSISKRPPKPPSISLDSGLVYVRRVQVTPCKVYFCGPEVNVSNRVLRKYPDDIDNFLRVSFVDEDLEKMYSTDLSPRASRGGRTELYRRVLSVLRNGVHIGDKKFEFLAFSSSQLRDNSLWMFASRPGLSASDIRRGMGTFSQIRNVAKYAARLGQSFGSSTETLSVYEFEIEVIPDVEVWTGKSKYIFSDGIGKISADFAHKVAAKCGIRGSTPSAFQIRYSGYKGVVAVDPTSRVKLSLRNSMCKYKSEERKLDVLAYSKYQPCFLNRQLITLLSTLGVRDHVFEKKQREAMSQLDAILTDPLKAQDALELMSPGENTQILKEMLGCGYKPDVEPYLSMMLQIFRSSKLLELRTKTRIFLPRARSMMGCLDETRTLEYGEVFVKVSTAILSTSSNEFLASDRYGSRSTRKTEVIQGKVVVAKNPCLHPGDVRVLQAVNVPELHHMVDCVVFPQKGRRPHPNECSGSDLDGDIYFVCWDSELIPPYQTAPMDYDAAANLIQDHDVTMEEVQEYFANYIVNDSLGIIANAHVVFADKEPQKALSPPCLELAKLFSIAVDFPKTGVAAEIPPHLHVKEYPDFMEKGDKSTYVSENVIGKLFREVKERAPETSSLTKFTRDIARRCYDSDMEYEGFEDHLDDAFYYKGQYDYKLGNLMHYYGIKTEAEILSGNIMRMSRSFNKRKDADAIGMSVRSLRKEVRSWFKEKGSGLIDSWDDDCVFAKASAWYHVTYHPSYWGCYNEGMKRDHFISFPWCVYDKLIHIKMEKRRTQRALGLSTLENRFSRGLII